MMDRRATFFLIAAMACFVLVPVGEPKFRGMAVTVGCVYVVLAVLVTLDRWGRSRR
jgi:peptidoglycan/LPS O-acetylase OafA/YrhL